jgi:hypothetical protein
LTHTGVDAFVTEKNKTLMLSHGSVDMTCEYDAVARRWLEPCELDPGRQMIGPFTTWTIRIPPGDNRLRMKQTADGEKPDFDGLTKLTLHFAGTCQTFTRVSSVPS